jgi:hypothetical protein
MDWGSERYVRCYTRDTLTWSLIGWEGRTTLLMLLRKVDRAGCLDVEGDVFDAVALMTDLPLELVVRPGLTMLIKRDVIERGNGCLIIKNFIAAQEALATDAQRARSYRERLRDKKRRSVTPRDNPGVTPRDDPSSHHVTEPGPLAGSNGVNVTPRDDPDSLGVTKTGSNVTPNRTVRNIKKEEEENRAPVRKTLWENWLFDVVIPAYPEHRRGSGLPQARAWVNDNQPDEALRTRILASVKEWADSAYWHREEGRFVDGIGLFFTNEKWNSHPKKPDVSRRGLG